MEGFIQAHAEKGVIVDRSLILDDIMCFTNRTDEKIKADQKRIEQLITENPNLTAFIATEYTLGILAKQAIEQLNLSVPDDFSIVCFDSPLFQLDRTSFTHIKQNEELIGKRAIETVSNLLNGTLKKKQNILLDATIVEGETTSLVRKTKVKSK